MKNSNINISVRLDDDNIPELITWTADDSKADEPSVVEAINLSFWDGAKRETMKMDLWTKNMPIHEMKMFYVDMVGSMADSIYNSTGDKNMADELKSTADKLMQMVENEFK